MIIVKLLWWAGLAFFVFRALKKDQWEIGGHYDRYKQYKKGIISKKDYSTDLILFFITWCWCLSAMYFAAVNDVFGVFP